MAELTRSDEVIIKARGLSKVYGKGARAKTAVQGVDLDIRRGDIYVLIGLSGSGKSTVLGQVQWSGVAVPSSRR